MVDAHKENNSFGGLSCSRSGVVEPEVGEAKANGSVTDSGTGSSGLGGGMLTYKRRRLAKVTKNETVSDYSETQNIEKVWDFLALIH